MSFFEIFNPGMKHLREERDRQNMLVSRPTHGGGSPLGIDLEGGKAKISLPGHTTSQEVEDETVEPDAASSSAASGSAVSVASAASGATVSSSTSWEVV